MNKAEIQKKLSSAVDAYKSLRSEGKADEAENQLKEIANLTQELHTIKTIEEAERAASESKISDAERKEINRYSFAKFMREAVSEKGLTGLELEMHQEALRSQGEKVLKGLGIPYAVLATKAAIGQNASTQTEGGNLIQEHPLTYLEMLRKKLVLTSLGAHFLTGLVGSVPVVSSTDPVFEWLDETENSTNSKVTTAKRVLTPKRTALTMAYSKDLLNQTAKDIESFIMEKMVFAHALGVETAAINGSGVKQPRGILNTEGIGSIALGTNGGALSWKNVVDLETAIESKDADLNKLAYLTNSKVAGLLRTTEKAAGTARYIMELRDQLNGLTLAKTNIVPSNLTKGSAQSKCSAMICGDFTDLYIGQWGGLDIVVDPYTLKKSAEVEITMNAWHDVLIGHKECFAAVKDILTD